MSNRTPFMNGLELEKHLQNMSDRDLMEFTARQVYTVSNLAMSNERRIVSIERRGNKVTGVAGAIGTLMGAAVIALINWLVGR